MEQTAMNEDLRTTKFAVEWFWMSVLFLSFAIFLAVRNDSIDDAYITYRHVWNLVVHEEPGFNFGDPVMGYSSPLHTMSLALLRSFLPVEVPILGRAFSIVTMAVFLASLILLLRRMGMSLAERGFTIGMIFCNGPFVEGCVFGLETPLVLLAMTVVLILLTREPNPLQEGIALAFLGLTRPDTVWFVPGWFLVRLGVQNRVGYFSRVLLSGIPLLIAWMLWATMTYGSPIPQSVIAKQVVYYSAQASDWSTLFSNARNWFASTFSLGLGAPGLNYSVINYVVSMAILTSVCSLGLSWYRLSAATRRITIVLAVYVACFACYSILCNAMHPWYFLPSRAAVLLLASTGVVNAIRIESHAKVFFPAATAALAFFLIAGVVVAGHHQRVEHTTRTKVHNQLIAYLKDRLKQGDELMLEPLGHIGWGLRGLRVIDFPGLVEPRVADVVKSSQRWSYGELMNVLKPRFVSLRLSERDEIMKQDSEALRNYVLVKEFQVDEDEPQFIRDAGDSHFLLYERHDHRLARR